MREVLFTPRADRDLREIWQTIASDSPRAAGNFLTRFSPSFRL